MQGTWDWQREGTLLTHGRWDGPQTFFYSPTLFTSGVRGKGESRAYTQVSRLPGGAFPPSHLQSLGLQLPPLWQLHPLQCTLPFPQATGLLRGG